jgi:Phage Mu protein F like protein
LLAYVRRPAPRRRRPPVVKASRPERAANRRARSALVRELGPLWQNLADGFRLQIHEGELAAAISMGGADVDALMAAWDTRAGASLADAFRAAIEAGSKIGARFSGLTAEATGITERAERWIATQGAKRIARINADTRSAVRSVLADALRDRASPARAAQDIGRLTGLTRQQAAAVRNYEATLIERRIPGGLGSLADTQFVRESIAQDLEAYRDRLLRLRGRTILETELQSAIQAGERMFWEQAHAEDPGAVDLDGVRKRWVTVADERVCPICEPLHDVVVRFDEHFQSGDFLGEGPPAHPNCRCYLEYEQQPAGG